MPGDPRECRLRAVKCLELAQRANSQAIKDNFVNIAATWQRLANQLEAMRALLEKIADENSDAQATRVATIVRADTGC